MIQTDAPETAPLVQCAHCGADCTEKVVPADGKFFCCNGCRMVYELLHEQDTQHCRIPSAETLTVLQERQRQYAFLDDEKIAEKIIRFRNGKEMHLTFRIPEMHCSSCIRILEDLRRIHPGVIRSRVNFPRKEVSIVFDVQKTTVRAIAEALAGMGYPPTITLDTLREKTPGKAWNPRVIRIGIAGFCFGNIMLLSFPEYFSSGNIADPELARVFDYLILILALPVFFYSASEFFVRSFQALKQKTIAIDVPIAVGIAAIFLRSAYEVVTNSGHGFFDSGTGLVFFMLIGRWFQDHTFEAMSFERDYASYFPVAVTRVQNGKEQSTSIQNLKVNDTILIHHAEIVPVDSILISGDAHIDYSFVTGEALPVHVKKGETIFAGGKQTGSLIELKTTHELAQSHLTQLWSQLGRHTGISGFEKLVRKISAYFLGITFLIAILAALYWWQKDVEKAINAFTAVLVIACPCALALSAPFTYGNILRILGKAKIYLRNYQVMERLADITWIVFDKTGTLTESGTSQISFSGRILSPRQQELIYSVVRHSVHPLSRRLAAHLSSSATMDIRDYQEVPGEGISANIDGQSVKIGSAQFVTGQSSVHDPMTRVHVSLGGEYFGSYVFTNVYRAGLQNLIGKLNRRFHLSVMSGDRNAEETALRRIFPAFTQLRFSQTPREKLAYVRSLQNDKEKVLMIGDGLNDAGALQQSDVGISIAEDTNNFTPASDIIMAAEQLQNTDRLLRYAKIAFRIIIWSFVISLLYNVVGLSFAVTGTLSPMIAAILMPISTISLVLFTVFLSTLFARRLGFSVKRRTASADSRNVGQISGRKIGETPDINQCLK